MKKRIAILLFIPFYTMHAQEPATGIAGEYYLQGVMETASVLALKPDSSFTFFSLTERSTGSVPVNGACSMIRFHSFIIHALSRQVFFLPGNR